MVMMMVMMMMRRRRRRRTRIEKSVMMTRMLTRTRERPQHGSSVTPKGPMQSGGSPEGAFPRGNYGAAQLT
jgi:hypothetical protein